MKTKNCRQCSQEFNITDDDLKFYDKVSPVFNGQKYPIPAPTLCPKCRLQQRTAHRNEQNLYHAKSTLSGKSIISIFSADTDWGKDLVIYTHEEWWSENNDATKYGRDYDFTRPFFEQFAELQKVVPRIQLIQFENENSPYVTSTAYSKNVYLINCSEYCEDSFYGKLLQRCRNVMDSDYAYDSELLYSCFYAKNCYNCAFLYLSQNCNDCYFSENLKSCKNCFLCTNLTGKEYYFMNEPYTKEEYEKKVEEFFGSHKKIQEAEKTFEELRKNRIHKFANIVNCENSTGDFLQNCKNCENVYDANDSEDCSHSTTVVEGKDLRDCSNMYYPEVGYSSLGMLNAYNVLFSLYTFRSQNVMYSDSNNDSHDLFGCVGLRKKQYCIFNKQYTKEEYESLVPKIIAHMHQTGEWGEFFPLSLSPFGYNETVAQEYVPLTKEEALRLGAKWKDPELLSHYEGIKADLPDNITDVSDEIVNQILTCETCEKNYRIIRQELDLYRKMHMPVARKCPSCRATERVTLHNPRTIWTRNCMKCNDSLQTTYSPDRPEPIYCEKCYLEAVY